MLNCGANRDADMPTKPKTDAAAYDDNTLFDALIGFAVDGIMVIDEHGIVRVYNKACERLFGYVASEVVGKNVKLLMPAPYHAEHDGYLEHYVRTGEKHIIGIGREVSGRRKDGTTFPMNLSVGEGVIRGERIFLGIITDISERQARNKRIQELQAEMLHVSRLTDMGQVAAGLAHELNQPLTAILNYTNAGLDIADEQGDTELKSVFAKVAEQASRAGNIIRRLRAFIEKREPNRIEEDLPRIVDEAIRLGQLNTGERGVNLKIGVEHNLPPVMIDRIQIQQVLINLMKNAIEAMEPSPKRELTVTIARAGEDLVQVSVADTGPGISAEMAEKLFQPFVTTKASGMGMGLNICRGIIESHGGRLWLEPNPGGGAVFRFNVPVAVKADA
jgi:two-component system, LuxR family, sensor kinase FixL